MGALTPARRRFASLSGTRTSAWNRAGLPAFCHRTFRSFRLQPPPVAPAYFWGFLRRAYRTMSPWSPVSRPVRHLGFAIEEQARHNSRPNRVHSRYGLIVHLRLLSTPPRGDAVTVSYEVPEHFGKDSHPAGSMQLQAHSPTLRVVRSPKSADTERPRGHSHGGPWERVTSGFLALYRVVDYERNPITFRATRAPANYQRNPIPSRAAFGGSKVSATDFLLTTQAIGHVISRGRGRCSGRRGGRGCRRGRSRSGRRGWGASTGSRASACRRSDA